MKPIFPPVAQAMIFATMVLFALYLAWELRRWAAGNRASLTPAQFRRRLIGGALLEVDLALWLAYDFVLLGRPPAERLLYLLFATLLLPIIMLLATLESLFIVRQYARWRGDLVRSLGSRESGGTAPGE
jgi:hypothetical protein